ncbi:hypothetical protein DNTS_006674 [Danionella cerebrum]|uniref:SP-RING-type domain-containing protein n=1 Tax=Danionella cerebrum TaxID=2873325 RepID=A0A553PWF8_9TELE|nr:hypothetical protein DNTS_006674 [Danionella translucida]
MPGVRERLAVPLEVRRLLSCRVRAAMKRTPPPLKLHEKRFSEKLLEKDFSQMVMSLRVSELQVLLGYAGRNKHGRKHELLTKALHLLKAGCSPAVQMKVKELYRRRFPTKLVSPSELTLPGVHPAPSLPPGLTQLGFDGHSAPTSPLLPISLLGPKHELGLPHLPTNLHHPVHPDVKLQRLSFYDMLDELIKPTSLGRKRQSSVLQADGGSAAPFVITRLISVHELLRGIVHVENGRQMEAPEKLNRTRSRCSRERKNAGPSDNSQRFQETCFAFALTPQQVQQVSSSMDISGTKCDFTVQVQLRFCLSETSCPQEDHFPPNLCVKVNGKPCNLPGYLPPTKNGVEPKRPSRPINITSLIRLSTTVPNTIVVSWTSEIGRSYSLAVYLVKQLSSTVLLQRLRAKGIRNPDHSRALIKEKLTADPDSEIATTSLRVSLLCPLGKMRLMIPCRALTCSHLQCFDATLYIQMNEKKPTWVCPVCDKKAPYEHLIIDGSSEEEEDEEPPQKRGCPSLSSMSPQMDNGALNLHRHPSPLSQTPSMPQMDNNYIPPPPPLIQDYRHYYPTPSDLSDLNFFPFLQGENHQHFNMVMAAAAASASDDHDLLLSRFLPYGSSQLFLDPPSTPVSSGLAPLSINGSNGAGSLRESLGHPAAPRPNSQTPTSALYGSLADVISLD